MEKRRRITIREAAAIMGRSDMYIRVAMQKGMIDIGDCFKTHDRSRSYSYCISPAKLAQREGLTMEQLNEELERIRACS